MSRALRAFMGGLVDYAGLFPPASLEVPAAVAEYAAHRTEAEAWMLGRFIAPAGRLAAIGEAAAAHLDAGAPWGFSVLVGARDDASAALAAVAGQAEQIGRFESALDGRVLVAGLEAPLPLAAAASLAPELLKALRGAGLGRREIYLETPAGADDDAVLATIARAATGQAAETDGFTRVGAKLRCGGVTADAFPSCERIAAVIAAAVRLDLPLKCTAGLHHPVRHRSAEPDVMMHGFLNVFGAGLLAWAGPLSPGDLAACVAETDPAAFSFTADAFVWRDHRVEAGVIARIRQRYLAGFGSCSFAEPRADLQTLGML